MHTLDKTGSWVDGRELMLDSRIRIRTPGRAAVCMQCVQSSCIYDDVAMVVLGVFSNCSFSITHRVNPIFIIYSTP